ncbi:MAG: hypothetical protein BLM47_02920 [Candidatus Reconcilbacillus cellulovorans]|uniref:DUF2626 domain-containing protein n=1 Tax=Candidatus Reconcilbacillus cellulovorans TaxID=1906605 RepID=A0A2A6E2G5_9BACL|nr:MAG: hypothetical protein BLM47_02920 [Candidatus Reconcilbacillus cellulovorans]
MARMYRVLGFLTLIMALMALAGGMTPMAIICFFQTAFFVTLGYMNLTERTYLLIFWGYMFVAFLGFTYWSFFMTEL